MRDNRSIVYAAYMALASLVSLAACAHVPPVPDLAPAQPEFWASLQARCGRGV